MTNELDKNIAIRGCSGRLGWKNLGEALVQGTIAVTDQIFAAIDRAKTRQWMDALDERGRADVAWRRDTLQ